MHTSDQAPWECDSNYSTGLLDSETKPLRQMKRLTGRHPRIFAL